MKKDILKYRRNKMSASSLYVIRISYIHKVMK